MRFYALTTFVEYQFLSDFEFMFHTILTQFNSKFIGTKKMSIFEKSGSIFLNPFLLLLTLKTLES
jgi:hypothetical protein